MRVFAEVRLPKTQLGLPLRTRVVAKHLLLLLLWCFSSSRVYVASVQVNPERMTERAPWWKAFLPKKKSGAKDAHPIGPDFDPWAPHQDKPRDPAHAKAADPAVSPADADTADGDERYDDSHMESVFNEKTCRRNMNVSRSGRFKEKRRVRKSLPIQDPGAKEEVR